MNARNAGGEVIRMHRSALLVFACFLFCSIRLFWIVNRYGVNVFIGDQWDYNDPTLFHPRSLRMIFRWQSGPWRQGLGGLLEYFIGHLTHWNTRYENFVAAAILVCGCGLALWLMFRLRGHLNVWDLLIPFFALSPVGYETVVGVTHYSHGPLPFLLVIAFCVVWTIRDYRVRYAALLVTAFFCTHTGLGLFIGIICPFVIAVDLWRRWQGVHIQERRAAIIALVFSLLSLSAFLAGFAHSDGVCPAGFSDPVTGVAVRYPNPVHYFFFLSFMFANFVGLKAPVTLAASIMVGSAVFLFMAWGFWWSLRRKALTVIPVTLIAYSLLFAIATAKGRMCLGLGAALGSRYMIYLAPAFIGVSLLLGSIADRLGRFVVVSILVAIAFATGSRINSIDQNAMHELRRAKSEWKGCYLHEHDLLDCNRKVGAPTYWYPDTIQDKIDFLERNHLNMFSGVKPGH